MAASGAAKRRRSGAEKPSKRPRFGLAFAVCGAFGAGTGFSVAGGPDAYANNMSDVGLSFVRFLHAFYASHPTLRANELWLTGESYGALKSWVRLLCSGWAQSDCHRGVACLAPNSGQRDIIRHAFASVGLPLLARGVARYRAGNQGDTSIVMRSRPVFVRCSSAKRGTAKETSLGTEQRLRRHALTVAAVLWAAGKYLPAIADAIIAAGLQRATTAGAAPAIPLRGVAIGNGLTVPREMTLSVPNSYFAAGILDAAQRTRAAALAQDCVDLIDAQNWTAATHARSVLFDYIENANGRRSAPNVDSFEVYGEYNETAIGEFLNSPSTLRSLNLPPNATWAQV